MTASPCYAKGAAIWVRIVAGSVEVAHLDGGPMDDMRENPPGWYRDPDRPKWHRYWDGESWHDPLWDLLEAERKAPSDALTDKDQQ